MEDTLITRYGAYGIIAQNGQFLLTQKKSGPYSGLWGLSGGGIEFGESSEAALKREIKEEAALEAKQLELLTIFTHTGKYCIDGRASQIHHIGIIYRVNSILHLTSQIPEEKTIWLSVPEIVSEELTPFAKQALLRSYFKEKI